MNYRVVATKRESIMKTLTLLVLLLTIPMVLFGQTREFNRVETTITSIEGEEKEVREISLKVEFNDSTITVNNTVYQVKQVFRNVYGDIWVILNNGDIIIDERRMIMRTKYTVEEVEYSQYQVFYSE
jgi:copper chaperone CopZ